jgi:hypothetical protein
VAEVTDAVLLPEPKRVHSIPKGRGAMGQSNVCYTLEQGGSPKRALWIKKAIEYVRSYSDANLLTNAVADAEDEFAADAERAFGRAQGRLIANAKTAQGSRGAARPGGLKRDDYQW